MTPLTTSRTASTRDDHPFLYVPPRNEVAPRIVEGWTADNEAVRKTVRIIDHHDTQNDISAMMRMTGYPAAIIAWLLASGGIDAVGACCQEEVVSGQQMIDELKRRGVAIELFNGKPSDPPV